MDDPTLNPASQLALRPDASGAGAPSVSDGGFQFFGDDGMTFFDLLDVINPLQHIPVVSTFYRQVTGDTLDHAPRVAGGALFGGPFGAAAAIINVIVDESTGQDLGEHMMAYFDEEDPAADGATVENDTSEAAFETAAGDTMAEPLYDVTETAWNPAAAVAQAEAAPRTAWAPPPAAHVVAGRPVPDLGLLANGTGNVVAGQTPKPDLGNVPESLGAGARAVQKRQAAFDTSVSDALRQAQGEANAAAAAQAYAPKLSSNEKEAAPDAVAGAAAPVGGWFSDVMLSALEKYRESAALAQSQKHAVNVTN